MGEDGGEAVKAAAVAAAVAAVAIINYAALSGGRRCKGCLDRKSGMTLLTYH